MKTIYPAIIVISSFFFLSFNQWYNSNSWYNSNLLSSIIHVTSCPSNINKAERDLREYLANEQNIKELRERREVYVDSFSKDNIYALEQGVDEGECEKLKEKFNWIENDTTHDVSIYKVADHYFVVRFLFTEKNEFERESIIIINSELEVVAVVLDF